MGNVPAWVICRSGDAGRRSFGIVAGDVSPKPKFGELFLSDNFLSGSRIEMRVGEVGKASSTGFRGMRIRLGDPGLEGRMWGEYKRWPPADMPGIDCVRTIGGGARVTADLDLT